MISTWMPMRTNLMMSVKVLDSSDAVAPRSMVTARCPENGACLSPASELACNTG